MFAILRGANGRRHEVDFGDDPVTIDVAMSPTTVQVTMTAADPEDPARCRFVTVALPRDALAAAMAAAAARPMAQDELGLRLVGED
jgi:hypothetical protein